MLDIDIRLTDCPKAKPEDETNLGFGKVFSDHMFVMDYEKGKGWYNPRIEPYHPFMIDPACVVFHYAQEIFEGLKAYRTADNTIQLFRPECNARRMMESADRLCMPEIGVEDFIQAVKTLVSVEKEWVPHTFGASLYLDHLSSPETMGLVSMRQRNIHFVSYVHHQAVIIKKVLIRSGYMLKMNISVQLQA